MSSKMCKLWRALQVLVSKRLIYLEAPRKSFDQQYFRSVFSFAHSAHAAPFLAHVIYTINHLRINLPELVSRMESFKTNPRINHKYDIASEFLSLVIPYMKLAA
jgi:hypothetical protein